MQVRFKMFWWRKKRFR